MNKRKVLVVVAGFGLMLASAASTLAVLYTLNPVDNKPAKIATQRQAKLKTTQQKPTSTDQKKKTKPAQPEKTKKSSLKKSDKSTKSCNTDTAHADPNRIDVIANKKHCLKPLNYAPKDLVNVEGALLRAPAATHYRQMLIDARKAGVGFRVSSSYRSYKSQTATYNYWLRQGKKKADTHSARPGYSEHQTGLTADLVVGNCSLNCFAGTKAYVWLVKNAHKYGFIERYPRGKTNITGYVYESWHWRYVGRKTATDMKQKNIKTLEEYWGIAGGGYSH